MVNNTKVQWQLAFLLIGVLAWSGCQKIEARKLFKKGNDYYTQELFLDALHKFQEGLELDPEATFIWRSVGLSAMALFKPGNAKPENIEYAKTAADAFKKYSQAFPKDEKPLEYIINMYLSAQLFDEAIEYLTEVRKERPEETKYLQPLMMMMVKAGRVKDAYDLAVRDAPTDALVFYTIAVHSWDRAYRDPTLDPVTKKTVVETGLKSIQKALSLKPDFASFAYINLLYREKGKLASDQDKAKLWIAGAEAWGKKAVKVRDEQKRLLAELESQMPKKSADAPAEGAEPAKPEEKSAAASETKEGSQSNS